MAKWRDPILTNSYTLLWQYFNRIFVSKLAIVGIPFSNDQKPNLLRAVKNGYARLLDWDNLSAEDLTKSIREAMEDENMRAALERDHS